MPQSTLISYINITYTLEVEVSEVLEHTKKQYVYIYIYLSINVTLKFFEAQIICASFFIFIFVFKFDKILKFF